MLLLLLTLIIITLNNNNILIINSILSNVFEYIHPSGHAPFSFSQFSPSLSKRILSTTILHCHSVHFSIHFPVNHTNTHTYRFATSIYFTDRNT